MYMVLKKARPFKKRSISPEIHFNFLFRPRKFVLFYRLDVRAEKFHFQGTEYEHQGRFYDLYETSNNNYVGSPCAYDDASTLELPLQ